MIPILVGAAALWGVSNMADAENKTRQANNINTQAAQIATRANRQVNNSHKNMTKVLDNLGRTKMDLMSGNISDVANVMGKIYKNFKLNNDTQGLRELEEGGINLSLISEMHDLSTKALELQNTKEFQNTSTGSFCAVGALGGAVLGLGVIAAPAMLLYSFMKTDEADAALYEAKTRLDEAQYYEERSKNIATLFNAIAKRGKQIDDLLNGLNHYFNNAVRQMKDAVKKEGYTWKKYSDESKAIIFYTFQIAQTVKMIVDTSMIQDDWSINPDIEKTIQIGSQTFELLSE